MQRNRRGVLQPLALLTGLSLALAACGGSPSPSTPGEDGEPKRGGTLKLLGAGDIDHMDTAAAYYSVTYTLLRGISRQLVTYPNTTDEDEKDIPVPDLATEIAEPTNDGKRYTFTIREGAQWDAPSGPRQITGDDVVRGFERLCNPVQPTGAPGYFSGVIVGMKDFCDRFGKVQGTIPAIKDFIAKNDVSGIKAEGLKVTIDLERPAGDFLNILAMPFASPVAVEMLDYLPDSPQFRQNFISSGPYKIEKYVADKSIELVRNPAWKAESDPVRKAWVDRVSVTQGSDEVPVHQQLVAGTADLAWDTSVPTADLPGLIARNDPRLSLFDDGSTNPYVTINLQSPNAGGALKKLEVRQAINYAVNKKNIIQVLGGPELYSPLGQVLTPPLAGYEKHDPYATPESKGDPEKAKQLLADAGYPDGLTLTFLYRNRGKAPLIAETLQADLKKAGITLKLKQVPPADFYTQYLSKPSVGKAGGWDLAAPGWSPDWQGNAARSFFVPLLDGRQCGEGSTNYNCYDNPKVNELIDQALAEPDVDKAAKIWAEADRTVMADAPWVPMVTGKASRYRSERVKGFTLFPFSNNADITNVWLDPAA